MNCGTTFIRSYTFTNMKNEMKLKSGRDKSLRRHDLWVFSGAVDREPQNCFNGDVIDIASADGQFLARAGWSPTSQIRARVWTFDPNEAVDINFFRRRIADAAALRRVSGISETCTAYRLIAAEGDDLSGIITDIYNDFAVVQFLSAGAERQRDVYIEALLAEMPDLRGIYERNDVAVRAKEGLEERTGVIFGDEPPELLEFKEHNLKFAADLKNGHKTGFYFDQRENRRLVGRYAAGKSVLNLFSYTGGFGVAAAVGGASNVENVDSSAAVLKLAAKNFELNNISPDRWKNTEANVFELLRSMEKEKAKFDLIVLDPPKLVESQSHMMKGCRAYKEMALRAFRLLNKNGLLFTFSCSGLVDAELFAKITFDASHDAGVSGAILRRLAQDADHPVRLNHPESAYLKGLMAVRI